MCYRSEGNIATKTNRAMPKKFILTDQTINNYGFIVLTSGIDLSRFTKNPVMLFDHCKEDILGRWDNIKVEGDQLTAESVFDEKDPEAMIMSGKVDQGFLNGTSIGFEALEFELGMPGFEDVPICTKCILMECSLTPLPSNGNAIRVFDREGKLMAKEDVLTVLSSNNKLNPKIEIKMKDLKLFIVALSLAADSTDEQVLQAVKDSAANNKVLEAKKTELEGVITELSTKVDAAKTSQITSLVENAIAAGKLSAGEKDTYVKLASADFDSVKTLIDAKKPHKELITQLSVDGDGKDKDPRKDWTFDDWSKKDSKGLLKMKNENAEKYKKLYSDFYQTA